MTERDSDGVTTGASGAPPGRDGAAVRRGRHRVACSLTAAAVYLGLALLVQAPVLHAPRELLPQPAFLEGSPLRRLDERDQKMVVSVVARNAAALTGGPLSLRGDGQCYPTPASYTLGEHMFGLGILAALPWAVTHDPILTFNVVLVLTLWIAALTMYALALSFTRSPSAAFVAGLLFELAPRRISDPAHPYVHGDLWTPLALLLLHRVIASGGWGWTAAFVVATSLVMAESFYPLLACAILMAAYGTYLAWRHRDRLVARLPQLVVAAASLLVVAWLLFGPYLETRATWSVLSARRGLLLAASYYLPGTRGFPGFVGMLLLLVGLLDRLRGPRLVRGEDPRLAFLAGGLLVLWATIGKIVVPGLGWRIPSPIYLLRDVVPGLDAVRALPAIGIGVGLPIAFLAGYGTLAIVERRGRAVAFSLLAGTTALVLAGRFVPALARPSFGQDSLGLAPYVARPEQESIDLLLAAPAGPLLDLPYPRAAAERLAMAESLLLASYSPRPTAACYNSFTTPVQDQVSQLADALPDARAADALAALGFAAVIVDRRSFPGRATRLLAALAAEPEHGRRLEPLRSSPRLELYRLSSQVPVRSGLSVLESAPGGAVDGGRRRVPEVSRRGGHLPIALHNPGDTTFRHPDPLAPTELLVRWTGGRNGEVVERRARALLPIALGPGGTMRVDVPLDDPPGTGLFVVQVARATEPERVLASSPVRVVPDARSRPDRQRRRRGGGSTP